MLVGLVLALLAFATPAFALGGVCLGDFFCDGQPTCQATSDCAANELCVLDSCCGPGVCVTRDLMCDTGAGASGSQCAPAGRCPNFAGGCGDQDASCQIEIDTTICFTTDIVEAEASSVPALSDVFVGGLCSALMILGIRRLRRE